MSVTHFCVGLIQSKNVLSNGNWFNPMRIRVIHHKYVLCNVNKYNPTRKCVIQRKYVFSKMINVLSNGRNVLSDVITCYPVGESVIQWTFYPLPNIEYFIVFKARVKKPLHKIGWNLQRSWSTIKNSHIPSFIKIVGVVFEKKAASSKIFAEYWIFHCV